MPTPKSPADLDKIRAAFDRLPGNVSNRDLARQTGLSDSSISAYRNGWRTPSPGNLVKLARALDVPVQDLTNVPA